MTGVSSNSIREPQSVARLGRTFSQSLSAVDLAEPLLSLDENQAAGMAAELMRERNITVLGVRREGAVVGWIATGSSREGMIRQHSQPFGDMGILQEGAGLDAVLAALAEAEHVFVEWLGAIAGVITRRDLQKPPLRMWLFGAITVLDTNLTRAIEELFPNDSWQMRLSTGRMEKAAALRAERERRGSRCELIDCLQIKDKADILMTEPMCLAVLGVTSRREGERLTSSVEKLRNHLAHAQELEPVHLATAIRLAASIRSIVQGEGVQRIIAAQRAAAKDSPS